MYNINKSTSSKKDALIYLNNKIACHLDDLKDRHNFTKMNEMKKLSREHARDFKQYQKHLLDNPHELLKGINVDDCVSLQEQEEETDLATD